MINHETLSLLEQLAPDLMKKLTLRAMILERISALQPVGRRALANRLHMPEREIRSICDALKEDGLICVTASGMITTERADGLLPLSRSMTGQRSALGQLEQHLSRMLNIARVCIVPGNADEENAAARSSVLVTLGRTAADQLLRLLTPGMTLTVSGGAQIAAVAAALPARQKMDLCVLPACGITDTDIETQADTLAARFAQALGGSCSMLHLPDSTPNEALKELMKLPQIERTMRLLPKTDVLLYGVEPAADSLKQRTLPDIEQHRILRAGAIGEAVGCYFTAAGHMVAQPSAVGLNSAHLTSIRCIAAVAAGSRRARALLSVVRHHRHELVILDEGAARALEKLV